MRARATRGADILLTDDAGRFFAADVPFLERLETGRLDTRDQTYLFERGLASSASDILVPAAHRHAAAQRFAVGGELDYLILVPTLRCNLSCSYCQVSRAPLHQSGFDWSEGTLEGVLKIIDNLKAPSVKIEFQGGEPTLRSDLLKTVMERSSALRPTEYVICTNLSEINDDLLAIMDRDDVYISTSLDGDLATHRANRTASLDRTKTFARNLDYVLQRYGPKKVSALPTVNSAAPPPADDLIDSFVSRGLTSIYLRPVTFHGFARKRHRESREQDDGWRSYYEAFVHNLIARNWADRSKVLDESYLTLCLNRVFRPGRDRHVDLRNPNPVGVDYIVIDHDGTVFPTDEARMLSRSKIVDLSIGDVHTGWDGERRRLLNAHATNQFDADCSRCAYQPYCGRDIVDDLARYGRIDLPRTETAFCRRHLHLFDLIFELIYADDEPTQYSLRRWLQLPGETATLAERLS